MDFAPFAICANLTLTDAWANWIGDTLAGNLHPPPTAPDFPTIEHRLTRHGVLPLLYNHLRDATIWPALAQDLRSGLTTAFQESATRTLLLQTELARIASASQGLGLLKGAALGHTIYANPALRPVSDLDLLVDAQRVPTVQGQLESIGYRAVGLVAHPRFGRLARRYRAELPLLGPVSGLGTLLVELHWSLAELPHYVDLIPATALFSGASSCSIIPGYVTPRPAVLLVYAAGHLALHHSRDLRLIWLVDLDHLVRCNRMNWNDVLELAEAWKLGLALYSGLEVVSRWLGTPLDPSAMRQLGRLARDPVAVRSWGLGDESPDRAWRRAGAALAALSPRGARRYAGWLALRAALRPLERRMLAAQGQIP